MFRRLPHKALAALLIAVLVTGCGSDSSDPDPNPPTDLAAQALALFPAGSVQSQATSLVGTLEQAAAAGNDAAAEAAAFHLTGRPHRGRG